MRNPVPYDDNCNFFNQIFQIKFVIFSFTTYWYIFMQIIVLYFCMKINNNWIPYKLLFLRVTKFIYGIGIWLGVCKTNWMIFSLQEKKGEMCQKKGTAAFIWIFIFRLDWKWNLKKYFSIIWFLWSCRCTVRNFSFGKKFRNFLININLGEKIFL